MKHLRHPFLIFGLITCFLLVGGVFASLSASHSLHHAHHKAATHATLICSWTCAAGEVLEANNFIFEAPSNLASKVEPFPLFLVHTTSILFTFQRGPPLSSF